MKQILVLSLLIFLCSGGLAQPRPPRRPPNKPPVQEVPYPYIGFESEFFMGPTGLWGHKRPLWSRLGTKPIIIGLAKGRDQFPRELIIEQELKRLAFALTRNVLVVYEEVHKPKDTFKFLASSDSRFCWLWLEADVSLFPFVWYHCDKPMCFGGSQAKISITCVEINPSDGDEYTVAGLSVHLMGHIHAWARRKWFEAGAPYDFYYFTMGLLLYSQVNDYFLGYLAGMLR